MKLEEVSDRPDAEQALWLATRRSERIRVCGHHLLADPDLINATPADGGRCAQCSEVVLPTRHAVDRWLLRVGGRTATEAGIMMLEFVRTAFTATSTPKWLRTPLDDKSELLLNVRWSEVGLVKRRSIRGADFDCAIIATVLTSAGPTP
jgi:hypothetical protein